jgi:hypothetical protein
MLRRGRPFGGLVEVFFIYCRDARIVNGLRSKPRPPAPTVRAWGLRKLPKNTPVADERVANDRWHM